MCVTQGAISWHFSVAAVRGWSWILGAEACSDLRSVSTAVSELCRDSWEITKPHAHRSRDAQPPRSKFAAHVGPYSAHVALRRAHTLRSSVLIRQPGNTQRSPRAQIYSSRKQPHGRSPREMARAPVWLSWAGETDETEAVQLEEEAKCAFIHGRVLNISNFTRIQTSDSDTTLPSNGHKR